jgi:hypothetical protein
MTDTRNSRLPGEEYLDIIRLSLDFFIARIKRSIGFFLLIGFAFCAAGVAYWYSKKPVYASELVCAYSSNRLTRKTFGEMAQKLDLLAKSRSYEGLSKLLNMPKEQVQGIISLEARNRSGSPLYEDITIDFQPIYFTLTANNREIFAPFQTAFVNYLNTSPYDSQVAAAQGKRQVQLLGFFNADLARLDSVIADYSYALRQGHITEDSTRRRSILPDFFQYKNWLEKQLVQLQERYTLESAPTVSIMHGFAPQDRPTRGSKKIILAFALIGLLAATGMALLRK